MSSIGRFRLVAAMAGMGVLNAFAANAATSVHFYCSPEGGGDGSGPESPCFLYEAAAKLTSGVSAADPSEIILADGEYDCSGWEGDMAKSIAYGETKDSVRNVLVVNNFANVRIASASGNRDKVVVIGGGPGSNLRFIAGRTSRTYIENITVSNFWSNGKCAVVWQYANSPAYNPGFTFTNCAFRACGCTGTGGVSLCVNSGIYFYDCMVDGCYGTSGVINGQDSFNKVRIANCWTTNGYAIGTVTGCTFDDVDFVSNVTWGAANKNAMAFANSRATFHKCRFDWNRHLGGAASTGLVNAYDNGSRSAILADCTFSNNTCNGYLASNCKFSDCEIVGNTANGTCLVSTPSSLTNVLFQANVSSGYIVNNAAGAQSNVTFRANTTNGAMVYDNNQNGKWYDCHFLFNTNLATGSKAGLLQAYDAASRTVYAYDCEFIGNVASDTTLGLIANTHAKRCKIEGNEAKYMAYACRMDDSRILFCTNTSATVFGGYYRNMQVVSNVAAGVCGFWGNNGNPVYATNCLVFANLSTGSSTPMVCYGNDNVGNVKLVNCTVAGNRMLGASASKGGGICRLTAYNTISVGNDPQDAGATPTLYSSRYGTKIGTVTAGDDNVATTTFSKAFKMIVDEAHPYGFLPNRALRDVGLPLDYTETDVDLAGNARKVGRGIDIGCYEHIPVGLLLIVR